MASAPCSRATAYSVWISAPPLGVKPRRKCGRRSPEGPGAPSFCPSTAGSSLAVVGPVVWAATNDGVVSVDQRSRQVTATLRIPGSRAIASGGSRLWVVGREGLYSVSARKVTKHFGLSGGEGDLIAVAGGAVWLSAGSSNSLRRFQP